VPLPGDVSEERLVQIYGDVAALAWKEEALFGVCKLNCVTAP
jgi:hypothetical protein